MEVKKTAAVAEDQKASFSKTRAPHVDYEADSGSQPAATPSQIEGDASEVQVAALELKPAVPPPTPQEVAAVESAVELMPLESEQH